MKLTDVFQSKAQVKLVQYLLENPNKLFSQASLAQFLDVSPSTIARIVEPLVKEGILHHERFERGMKIFALNESSEKTKALADFQQKISSL